MNNATTPPAEERSEARRRLHLRDITTDTPLPMDTVGAELRSARMRRGDDLRTIAQALRIRREQLEALEEARYDDLPGRAYAIGFIRSYAEYLGLDTTLVVDRYKAEIDLSERAREDLTFPKVTEETRLPRGTFLIVGVVVVMGIYGGWLLSRSADKMMAERVPPVPERIEARSGSTGVPDEHPTLSGDPASAATRPYGGLSAVPAKQDPAAVYAIPPAVPAPQATAEETPASASTQTTALDPQPIAAETPAPSASAPALPPLPAGQAFGSENLDGRVVIRARKNDAWVRVEDGQGHVLIERTLALGDSYRAPAKPGVILVARDASAFELLLDGTSLGLAGPPTLVLTGKSLDVADLVAALPKPAVAEVAAPAPAPAPAPGEIQAQ
ncbi:MAG TPA: RodZ domain-containing protein [Parvibaculum sp.]|nr:RodZ domain-containing protein [Parvibaculum sp.]